jgi:hypothetical protein
MREKQQLVTRIRGKGMHAAALTGCFCLMQLFSNNPFHSQSGHETTFHMEKSIIFYCNRTENELKGRTGINNNEWK